MNPYKRSRSEAETERIVFHLPAQVLESIDRWGVPAGMPSRSEAIRTLLKKGLEVVANEAT